MSVFIHLVSHNCTLFLLKTEHDELEELFAENIMTDILTSLPSLCRFQYNNTVQFIFSILSKSVASYQALTAKVVATVEYRKGNTSGNTLAVTSMEDQQTLSNAVTVAEAEIAYLIFFISSLVGSSKASLIWSARPSADDQYTLEADLCTSLWKLIPLTEFRMNSAPKQQQLEMEIQVQQQQIQLLSQQPKSMQMFQQMQMLMDKEAQLNQLQQMQQQQHAALCANVAPKCKFLDKSILYFFRQFHGRYCGMQAVHTFLEPKEDKSFFLRMTSQLGYPFDQKMAVLGMLQEIITCLHFWGLQSMDSDPIASAIALFDELTTSYVCSMLLVKLPATRKLLLSCHSMFFPFLRVKAFAKERINWFACFGRLLVREELLDSLFDAFMKPHEIAFEEIEKENTASPQGMRSEKTRELGRSVCLDLEGLLRGLYKKEGYDKFFEWLYPHRLNIITRLCETFWQDKLVISVILSFLAELVFSRSNRIQFPAHSANGTWLFKEACKIICTYSGRIVSVMAPKSADDGVGSSGSGDSSSSGGGAGGIAASHRVLSPAELLKAEEAEDADDDQSSSSSASSSSSSTSSSSSGSGGIVGVGVVGQNTNAAVSLYHSKIKGTALCLTILNRAIQGTFCNFGVLSLYKDYCLIETIQSVLRLAFTIPMSDVVRFPKLTNPFFSFLATIVQHQLHILCGFDSIANASSPSNSSSDTFTSSSSFNSVAHSLPADTLLMILHCATDGISSFYQYNHTHPLGIVFSHCVTIIDSLFTQRIAGIFIYLRILYLHKYSVSSLWVNN
jgi:hypothetical protein